jgi:hypothetical protein
MFPVEAIPWPFSPPMPTAKSILFITPNRFLLFGEQICRAGR